MTVMIKTAGGIMTWDSLIELLRAFGRFFINPLFYITLLFAVFLGYCRVKRERKNFNIRILSGWTELKDGLVKGLLMAVIISLLSLAVGLVVPVQFLFILMVFTIIAMIGFSFYLLSPIVLFAVSFTVLIVMKEAGWAFTVLGFDINGLALNDATAITICLLAGVALIAEGFLIRKQGEKFASPITEQTKRGLKAVTYLSKQLWILPVFFVVPGEAIEAYFPYWPQFSLGANEFSIVLFPVVIGFQQKTRKTLPRFFYAKLGKSVMIVGQLVVIGGLISYFEPLVGTITLIVGACIRLLVSLQYKWQQRMDTYAVAPTSTGAMIAAVLPNSPAEKMGLVTGEVIKKVNGRNVCTERELYEALQINAAHCRIEVLDHQNELRLTQHAVHSDDHHRIGLLLAH